MAIKTINDENLVAIATSIRNKNGLETTYKPSEMAAAIDAIQTGIEPTGEMAITENGTYDVTDYATATVNVEGSGEGYTYEGSMAYMFHNYLASSSSSSEDYKNGFSRLTTAAVNGIKNTKDVTSMNNCFYKNTYVTEIPFEINITDGTTFNNAFYGASNLTKCPKINGKPGVTSFMFYDCRKLKDVSALEDLEFNDEYSTNARSGMFQWCNSLRHIPEKLLRKIGHCRNGNYYLYLFSYCTSLEEVVNLGVTESTRTSNTGNDTFGVTSRLKRMTYETNEDGTPIVANWHTQTITLSNYVGYMSGTSYATTAGFTEATRVIDDATYQALKDNPDYWTTDVNYSRYNHDSAVETINSLPDTSAYLAKNSGKTNTIKFKGTSGALTDGGAINTLTEEEIAVAAAKGWTVSLV